MQIQEKLLFAVHRGTVGARPAGVTIAEHCLPIACSHSSWEKQGSAWAEAGVYALWESLTDTEEFFGILGITAIEAYKCDNPQGLYVYEVEYNPDDFVADEEWGHLQGGTLRRPTLEELEPLMRDEAPWGGVVL